MKRIEWEDMKDYGIRPVTGEACGLSMRVLYEFTEDAWNGALEFFGIREALPNPFITNAFSTLMLPPETVPYLLVYLVMRKTGVNEVLFVPSQKGDGYRVEMAIYVPESPNDADYAKRTEMLSHSKLYSRFYRKSDAPGTGFRNQHWFTGMTQ